MEGGDNPVNAPQFFSVAWHFPLWVFIIWNKFSQFPESSQKLLMMIRCHDSAPQTSCSSWHWVSLWRSHWRWWQGWQGRGEDGLDGDSSQQLTEACDDGSAGIRKQWRQWNNFYDNFLSVPVTGESGVRDTVQRARPRLHWLVSQAGEYHDNTEIITQIIQHNCTITLHL